MEVAWFDTQDWEEEYLDSLDHGLEIDFFEEPLEPGNSDLADGYDAVSVFISSAVTEEVIDSIDAQLICCRSTGYDHVDVETARDSGVAVCNVPEYGSGTVAEHTFGLILALSRKIYDAIEKVKHGDFDHEGLRGFDLEGKKLGVIGTGAIGKRVIEIANGFRMHVVASDSRPDRIAEERLGFMYVTLEDLLEQSDIVTVHCPLNESTRHLLSREEFERMDGTVLINTARGEIVDTDALIEALEEGNVSAAGLDVLEEECYLEEVEYLRQMEDECDIRKIVEDHVLMEREDVLVTPHNGFNSQEVLGTIVEVTLNNLRNRSNIVNRPGN